MRHPPVLEGTTGKRECLHERVHMLFNMNETNLRSSRPLLHLIPHPPVVASYPSHVHISSAMPRLRLVEKAAKNGRQEKGGIKRGGTEQNLGKALILPEDDLPRYNTTCYDE